MHPRRMSPFLKLCLLVCGFSQVMEMMVEYIASDDMLAVLGGTARKRVALGLSAQALVSDFHLEGKVRSPEGVNDTALFPYPGLMGSFSFSGVPSCCG